MRSRLCVSFIVAVAVSCCSPAKAALFVWPVADAGNGHAYELIAESRIWTDALFAATQRPTPAGFGLGHLVTISDRDEHIFVAATFGPMIEAITGASSFDGAWIGFTDSVTEGEWRWIDDTPGIWQDPDNFNSPIQTAYVNWNTHEPNNSGAGEDFADMRGDFVWNDYFNASSLPAYIVEYEPVAVPEPSTFVLFFVIAATSAFGHSRRKGLDLLDQRSTNLTQFCHQP